MEAGCTAYLTKPVDLDALVEELARLLGGERRADAPEETPPGDAIAAERPEQEWTGDDTPLVSRLASNPRFHATIEKFVCRLEEKLEAMQACWDARDFEELAKLAHWLKGSGGTVGFDAFSAPAKTLELLAKEGKESEIEASISELRQLAERVVVPGRDDGARQVLHLSEEVTRGGANSRIRPGGRKAKTKHWHRPQGPTLGS